MKRIFIIIICCFLIIALTLIVVFFLISPLKDNEEDQETLDIQIEVDDSFLQIDQTFDLWIDNCPEEADVVWNLGDGTIKNGQSITHSYDHSRIYNVTVNVTKGSDHGWDYKRIIPRNHPVDTETSGTFINEIGSSGNREVSIHLDIQPGYFVPIYDGYVHIKNAIGDFEVVVTVWDLNNPNGYHEELVRESYTGRRNGLTFDESLLDTPVPPMGTIYRIELKIIAEQGVSGEYQMTASLFY